MTVVAPLRNLLCAVLVVGLTVAVPAAAAGETGSDAAPAGEAAQGGEPAAVAPRANLPELEDEVMCPICGTLLGLSRAPAAERQRVFIRRLIREGKTEQEIKDALVAEYGPQVLALPDDEDTNFWVYVVPVAGLIIATLAVLLAAVRWRRNREPDEPSGGGGGPGGPSGPDASRLDRDLAEYDL